MTWQTIATAAKSTSSIFDDDWDVTENSAAEKPKIYLEFNTPPLALVIAMQEAGKKFHEIYEALIGAGKHSRIDIVPAISAEHQKRAAEIYKHFQQKYTMRRIKGEYISNFMLVVEDLCENRKKIDLEHVRPLMCLPKFYDTNLSLERIMKTHKSAKQIKNIEWAAFRGEIQFIERVHCKTGRNNEYHYFFSTPKNYLMRVVVKKGEYGYSAWNTISKIGKVNIEANVVYVMNIKGYKFNVLQPSPDMEISIV